MGLVLGLSISLFGLTACNSSESSTASGESGSKDGTVNIVLAVLFQALRHFTGKIH
jgi:hypothetical protein